MGLKQKIEDYINKCDKKKMMQNILLVCGIGIVLLIAADSIFDSGTRDVKQKADETTVVKQIENVFRVEEDELEIKLERILSRMEGVGNVSVMITYCGEKQSIPAYDVKIDENRTSEKDANGGTRTIESIKKENSVIYEQKGGDKKPFILSNTLPEVKGVVVIAEGADDAEVKKNIVKAVQALMDVPLHRIQVFERKKDIKK